MLISTQQAQNIVDQMKSAIQHDINIMDENGLIIASTNLSRCGTIHTGAQKIIAKNLSSLTIETTDSSDSVQAGVNLPIIYDNRTVGVVGITGNPNEVSVFGAIISRMTVLLIKSAKEEEELHKIERAKSIFVENWLFDDSPDWNELEIRGRLLGFRQLFPYRIAILNALGTDTVPKEPSNTAEMQSSSLLQVVQNHLQNISGHFCTIIRNSIIVLLSDSTRPVAENTIYQICSDIEDFSRIHMTGGVSSLSTSVEDIRRCYLEARAAASIAAESECSRVLFYDQMSLPFIAQSIPKTIRKDLRAFIFSSCSAQEKRMFLQLIRLYYNQNGNIQKCAEKMYIHRNTFQYRMGQLQKKTGKNLKNPSDAILLYLTL